METLTKVWKCSVKSRVLNAIENARCRVKANCEGEEAEFYLEYLDRDENNYILKLKDEDNLRKYLLEVWEYPSCDFVWGAYKDLRLFTLDYEIVKGKLETGITIAMKVGEDKIEDFKKFVIDYYNLRGLKKKDYDYFFQTFREEDWEELENGVAEDMLRIIKNAVKMFDNDYFAYQIDL